MDSNEDTIAGADAGANRFTHEGSDITSPGKTDTSVPELHAASNSPSRGSSEENVQEGAQGSDNVSVKTSTSANSYKRRTQRHAHGRSQTTGYESLHEGHPNMSAASRGRRVSPDASAIAPPSRSISSTSRISRRVSFGDNTLPAADTITLPASSVCSVATDTAGTTTQVVSSTLNSLEQLQKGVASSRSGKGYKIQHNQYSNDSIVPLSDQMSNEHAATSSLSGRSDDSVHADQVALPASVASSNYSGDPYPGLDHAPTVPLGGSLEQLPVHVERISHPARKKVALLNWIAGPPRPKKKAQRSWTPMTQFSDLNPTAAPETEDYRASIEELANHFPTFKNVAMVDTRHDWSSRIVLHDHTRDTQGNNIRRYEPWLLEDTPDPPPFEEFRDTLKDVPDDCVQRVILVEDLTPALIDLLGATFQIPPHVFEEHLERSGYAGVVDDRDDAAAWHTRPSAHGYSSITWYRPVLPLVPVTPKFYAKIIGGPALPRVQCPIEGCKRHSLWLDTTANIWRHRLDLCTDPGSYYKNSATKYPVGWEERVTVWTQKSKGCEFVIVLLDPLPMVTVEYQEIPTNNKRRPRVLPTVANLWVRQREQAARAQARRADIESQRQRHVQAWMEAHTDSQGSSENIGGGDGASLGRQQSSQDPEPSSRRADHSQATATDMNAPSTNLVPAPLRRRFTKPSQTRHILAARRGNRPNSNQLSEEAEMSRLKIVDPTEMNVHQDFVVYEPIKARASSDTDTTYDMTTYIDSLQNPRSTLEEFDHFLVSSKGKSRSYDPFLALFRTIHDDSNTLADIIRTSMQRIREGTMDEDFMQKRVRFWRGLLHRLSFHLAVLEHGLNEFEQFVYEPEVRAAQTNLLSQTLSKDTQRMLRGCMDLIDRCSHSLLAEMQIADSRRGIAEAESVSKLTELAFVFIPLSFVASLFSMQIHELDGGVPAYQFALVAIGIVFAAYVVRLSIRSARLIEYRDNFMRQVNEESGLRPDENLPTHKFLVWAGANIGSKLLKNSKNTAAVLAPLVVALAVITGVLSPIVLLWQRNINAGFAVAITVLILLLDGILVVPVVVNLSNVGLINFDPRDRIRRIQIAHEQNQKRRQKERRRRRREAGRDPEAPYEESSIQSEPDLTRKMGSLNSSST